MAARKTPKDRVVNILTKATPKAAKLLAQTLTSEDGTYSMKIDCAKEILNRVYGRAGTPFEDGETDTLKVIMQGEAEEEAI